MSRQTAMPQNADQDLRNDAEAAAKGDDSALDRLFAALGGSAWGLGFAAADAVGPATDAVSKGFAELLQLFDNGLPVGDIRTELLRLTRHAALAEIGANKPDDDTFEGAHAREPLTLLGETKDRQATLAFTALSESSRSALWLTEAEGFSITKTSQLLDESHKTTEDIVRLARANFRAYYVDAVKRDGLSEGCNSTLDKLAAYVGRSLPAGDVAAVEHHLAECKDCRSIVMKLDDLEGRLHAAIPALPAWTRQQVADTWTSFVPLAAAEGADAADDKSEEKKEHSAIGMLVGLAAVIIAFVTVLVGTGAFNSSDTSKVATPTTETSAVAPTTEVSSANTQQAPPTTEAPSQVATPVPNTPTTEAPAPATTQPQQTTPTTTARRRVAPTTPTTAAPTTTTAPALISLPPRPIGG